MNLKNKIPVPEMDELRTARLERSLVAQADLLPTEVGSRNHRLARFAVALVAVAGVVLAIGLNFRSASSPNTVVFRLSQASVQPTEVVTGPGQETRLLLGDAEVLVRENSRLTVERFPDGRSLLSLASGGVFCEVEPRPQRPVFQVVSGDVEVTVIGTAFEVTRGRTVEVRVEHGIVGVQTSSEDVKLRKGDEWRGSPKADVLLATILSEVREEKAQATELVREAAIKTTANTGNRRYRRHVARSAKSSVKTSGKSVSSSDSGPKTLRTQVRSSQPRRPRFGAFGRAQAELQTISSSDPKEAVLALERVAAESTGEKASAALYARAYLLLFRMNNNSLASKAVAQYSRRFPKGPHSEDILWLDVRAQCGAKVSSRCRSAAHTYLWRFPQGRFTALASRITDKH